MDPDTFRGDVGVEGADVYWRRRVTVLTGMLIVVAVVAWACTNASGKPGGTSGLKATPTVGDSMVVSLPPGLAGKAVAPNEGTPGGTPLAARVGTSSPVGSPVGMALSPSASPSRSRRPGDPCDFGDLVVALRGKQDAYGRDTAPTFLLTVVSTSPVECAVDLGPRALEMRITSGGERIWSTADCVAGPGVDRQTLERGVPYVREIRWDRRRSAEDCSSRRRSASVGTYVANAHVGRLKSQRVVFHLQ